MPHSSTHGGLPLLRDALLYLFIPAVDAFMLATDVFAVVSSEGRDPNALKHQRMITANSISMHLRRQ
jgi:hypothetical protein